MQTEVVISVAEATSEGHSRLSEVMWYDL